MTATYNNAHPRSYGWKPDLPGHRARMTVHAPSALAGPLPRKFSLRPRCPTNYDQQDIGSCTANMLAFLLAFRLILEGKLTLQQACTAAGIPARLFIYYLERAMEGTINEDAGAMIYDGLTVLQKYGAPFENVCPYITSRYKQRPSKSAYNLAILDKVIRGSKLDIGDAIAQKTAIFQNSPVGHGFTVYQSFESDQVAADGKMPVPDTKSEEILGGHAVARIGWDDDMQLGGYDGQIHVGAWEERNSWGSQWGDHGNFWMPYDFGNDTDQVSDATTVDLV